MAGVDIMFPRHLTALPPSLGGRADITDARADLAGMRIDPKYSRTGRSR
jgi:hypothetical protein